MGYKFNPLIFAGLDISGSGSAGPTSWLPPVNIESDLPAGSAGDACVVLDTNRIYIYDSNASKWVDSEVTVSSFETVPSNEGVKISTNDEVVGTNTITRDSISITPADGTHPGAVSVNNQSFAGDKTFNNDVIVSNDLTVGHDLDVNNNANVDVDLTVGQDVNITRDISVTNNSLIGGTQTVTGNFRTNSNATIDNNLQVDGNAVIDGDLTINGTTTTINTTNLDVEDKNITINKNGTDVSAEGAGFTVERETIDGSFIYDKDVTSKWKIGDVGSEIEVSDISSSQTLTNKTIDADSNIITNVGDEELKSGINVEKLADGSVTNNEFQYISTVTSNVQDQIDSKINSTEKAIANGVATLDVDGLIPVNQLPDLAKIDTHNVADEAAMLSLLAEKGDHAVRADSNNTFILKGNDPSTLSDWQEIISRVTSVNGLDKVVVLTTTEISEGTNLYYTEARFDASLGSKTTTDITEGTNLYYTQTRFDTAFTAKSTTNLSEGSNLYYTQDRFDTALAAKNSDNVSEGSTNLYYTEVRFNSSLSNKTTDDVSEGVTNLYFTNARVDAAVADLVTDSPVGNETDKAASIRASRSYTDSQEVVSLLESQTDVLLVDLVTDYSINSGCKVLITVKIDATTNLYEMFDMNIVKHDSGYYTSAINLGDNSLVDFDVDSTGKLIYTSSSYVGFSSGECVIKVIPLL